MGFVSSYLYTQGRHRMQTAPSSKYVIPDDRDGSFLKRAQKKYEEIPVCTSNQLNYCSFAEGYMCAGSENVL